MNAVLAVALLLCLPIPVVLWLAEPEHAPRHATGEDTDTIRLPSVLIGGSR